MTYKFLTDADIHTFLKEEFKTGMTNSGAANETRETFILKAEAAAIKQISNKIRQRYDVAAIFALPPVWGLAVPYTTFSRCSREDKFYIALKNGTGNDPKTETTFWEEDDPRDPYIVTICCDLMIYHLHARNNPRGITEQRVLRKDDALRWLNDVQDGIESPDLPLIEGTPPGDLQYGFDQLPRSHYY